MDFPCDLLHIAPSALKLLRAVHFMSYGTWLLMDAQEMVHLAHIVMNYLWFAMYQMLMGLLTRNCYVIHSVKVISNIHKCACLNVWSD